MDGLIENCTKSFQSYEYSRAKQDVEQFFWHDFCDNYLEIVKKRVYQGEGDKKLSAQYTLYKSLLVIVKLLAPIMPFITEEIYQEHFKKLEKDESIHVSSWPEGKKVKESILWENFVKLVGEVRQEKSKAEKAMNSEIVLNLKKEQLEEFKEMAEDLENVTNAQEIKEGDFEVEFI